MANAGHTAEARRPRFQELRYILEFRIRRCMAARDTAKLGAKWRPAFNHPNGQPLPRCPSCGRQIMDDNDLPIPVQELAKKRMRCRATDDNGVVCDQPLWRDPETGYWRRWR